MLVLSNQTREIPDIMTDEILPWALTNSMTVQALQAWATQLIDRQNLKAAAADNLKAVILYGSAATEEFHAKHSDLNILCVVDQADAAHLEALHGPVEW